MRSEVTYLIRLRVHTSAPTDLYRKTQETSMLEPILFKPKRATRTVLMLALFLLMLAFALYNALAQGDLLSYAFAAMCVAIAVALPFRTARRVEFGEKIVVRRFLLPPYEFDYTDITDMSATKVQTKRGRGDLDLAAIQNVYAFEEALARALKERGLPPLQLENKLALQEVHNLTAVSIVQIVAVPTVLILVIIDPAWLYTIGDVPLILYIILSLAVYFISRRVLALRREK